MPWKRFEVLACLLALTPWVCRSSGDAPPKSGLAESVTIYRDALGVAHLHGPIDVAVVEFGPELRARSFHTFGASADPSSPHHFDQAPGYLRGEFKNTWLTLEDVQTHAERSYHP